MKIRLASLAVTVLLLSGVVASVRANVDLVATYKNTPENTSHILSIAAPELGLDNVTSLLRLEGQDQAPSGSPFTIDYLSDSTAVVSWNLTGTGMALGGIYVFGGSRGANLYQITDAAQMIEGSATIHTPLTGNSGQFAGISHTLFLGTAVPEPSTLFLLCLGGAGFFAWRSARKL
jgi:hypothetical protein